MGTAAFRYNSVRFEIPRAHSSREAKNLRTSVERSLEQGDRHLVVDCEGCDQLDLIMLSSLIQCAAACRASGASFEVANVSKEMKRHVRELGLVERLGLNDD